MSAIANYIDPFQDYSHSDDQNTLLLPLGSNHLLLFLKRIIIIIWLNSMFSFVFLSDLEEF